MLDPQLRDKAGSIPSVEVNIFAADATEQEIWKSMSVSEYWKPGDPVRQAAQVYVMKFGRDLPIQQTLAEDHAIWSKWQAKHPRNLFIIAYVPGMFGGKAGADDPRRLILPLDPSRWENFSSREGRQIRIMVKPSGLVCLTPPKAEEDK
jgi:hypothetical protein